MTEEVQFVTKDDLRQVVNLIKGVVKLTDGLQAQINIMNSKSIAEIKEVVDSVRGKREGEEIGLEGLHKMADVERKPRLDANGDPIPWDEQHDYFMAFDPKNPDIPTD